MGIKIKAIEKQLPKRGKASVEIDQLTGRVEGSTEAQTGVAYRYQITDGESVCEMGTSALQKALTAAKMDVSEIDLLIFAGASFDYPIPHNSAIIKSKITDDAVGFHCLDINSTCLSFLNALDIAHLYLNSGRYKTIALVCSEVSSKALSPEDEKVFGLFGDAAVAVILTLADDGYYPIFAEFINYPSGAFMTNVPIGGAVNRGFTSDPEDQGYFFKMNGKGLFRLTTKHLDHFIIQLQTKYGLGLNDFDVIIPHQTSKMGNIYFKKHFGLEEAKIIDTLSIYGNCISASIPLGLEQYFNQTRQKEDQKLLLIGSGAGLSIGAIGLQM